MYVQSERGSVIEIRDGISKIQSSAPECTLHTAHFEDFKLETSQRACPQLGVPFNYILKQIN